MKVTHRTGTNTAVSVGCNYDDPARGEEWCSCGYDKIHSARSLDDARGTLSLIRSRLPEPAPGDEDD
jgi:hypothetical protein